YVAWLPSRDRDAGCAELVRKAAEPHGRILMSETSLTTQEQARAQEVDKSIAFGDRGLEVRNLEQARRFAQMAMQSGLTKAKTIAEVVAIVQTGSEWGFSLMHSLRVMHSINGVICAAVEAQVAKVESDGALEPGTKIRHRFEGAGEDRACIAWSFPKGGEQIESEPVYLRDFKHLRAKDNWKNYPDRMLKARAVGFHIRDYYSRCTNNLPSAEEAFDYDEQRGAQPMRDVTPPKGPDPLLAAVRQGEPEQPELIPCAHPRGYAENNAGDRVCVECGEMES
ncbi:MAG: hypothetical protein WA001_05600, partial [Patescibacteria group bacterium]